MFRKLPSDDDDDDDDDYFLWAIGDRDKFDIHETMGVTKINWKTGIIQSCIYNLHVLYVQEEPFLSFIFTLICYRFHFRR